MSEAKVIISAKDKTAKAFNSVNSGLSKLGGMLTSTQAKILGLVGAGGMGAFIKISADSAREATAFADALGITTGELQAWQHAAKTVNIEGDKMADIMKDVADKIGDAFGNEGGEALDVLERLNLNIADMARLAPDQQLLRIGEALESVSTQSERVQMLEGIANDASLLLPLLDNNAEKLRELRDEAYAAGVTLNELDAAKLQQANEAITRALSIAKGFGQTIAVTLAPYLEAITEMFSDSVVEHNGFRDEILSGTRSIVEGVAFMGDIWRGLEVVWKGLEVVFLGFISAVLTALDELQRSLVAINNSFRAWANSLIDDINRVGEIFGQTIEKFELVPRPENTLSEWANESREALIKATAELENLVMTPMPSAEIKAFFDELEARANRVAEAKANEKEENREDVIVNGTTLENYTAAQQLMFEKIKFGDQWEIENLRQQRQTKLDLIDSYFQDDLIRQEERDALKLEIEKKHQDNVNKVIEKGYTDRQKFAAMSTALQAKTVLGELTQLSAGAAQHSKAMFKLNKAAGIANAIVSAYTGASKSLETYPWPLAGIMAGVHFAAGMANVAAIKSTSFTGGGGGTTPSAATTPVVNDTPVQSPPDIEVDRVTVPERGGATVIFNGPVFADEDRTREIFVGYMREAQRNDEI